MRLFGSLEGFAEVYCLTSDRQLWLLLEKGKHGMPSPMRAASNVSAIGSLHQGYKQCYLDALC